MGRGAGGIGDLLRGDRGDTMKYWFCLIVFVCLTAPNGRTVYFAKDQVAVVLPAVAGAPPSALTQIDMTSGKSYYVVEDPQVVTELFK